MQVARYNPDKIVIFDIYENCAFELFNALNEKYNGEIDVYVRIGSVRDTKRLDEVFAEFHPDVVFHAAAHKHVPLMEVLALRGGEEQCVRHLQRGRCGRQIQSAQDGHSLH